MYYSYRKIDGYGCPLEIIISRRGIGKTFGAVKDKCIWRYITEGKRFIYIVQTVEMVKTLTMNKGEKFFSAIIEYCKDNPSNKNNRIFDALGGSIIEDFIIKDKDENKATKQAETIGGAIRINGETAGYIIAFDDYGNMKRNNFIKVGTIVIDEFIPEKRDIRNLRDPYKIVSVIQSIARLQDVNIVMLANAIRTDDPILERLGLTNLHAGEFRKIKLDGEIFGVCHFVDNKEYAEYDAKQNKSIAGKFARLLGETSLDKNEFSDQLDKGLFLPERLKPNHLLCCLHGDGLSVRIHATNDYKEYYVMHDYGSNTRKRYCIDKKDISPTVYLSPMWGEQIRNQYQLGNLRFETQTVFFYFKSILKIN